MIAELWTDPEGNVLYRMDNWGGFYAVVVNAYGDLQGKVRNNQVRAADLPAGSVLRMREGAWIA